MKANEKRISDEKTVNPNDAKKARAELDPDIYKKTPEQINEELNKKIKELNEKHDKKIKELKEEYKKILDPKEKQKKAIEEIAEAAVKPEQINQHLSGGSHVFPNDAQKNMYSAWITKTMESEFNTCKKDDLIPLDDIDTKNKSIDFFAILMGKLDHSQSHYEIIQNATKQLYSELKKQKEDPSHVAQLEEQRKNTGRNMFG